MEAVLTRSTTASDLPVASKHPIPWYCYAVIFAASCITVGIIWDISWHLTIGRDTFWTPAHMVIYVGGLVSGLCSGWLVFKATFLSTPEERANSVSFWGVRGPIGAWVCIWGACAMLVSAPFDDWWHNTYGLDVRIISPPHAVLAAGMHHIVVGALLLVLSLQNRSTGRQQKAGSYLFIFASGIMIALASTILVEFSFPNYQHGAIYYHATAALYPAILIPVARASRLPWPATTASAIFMLIMLSLLWILPLFQGTPLLAPIYNPVTHMVPPTFPILLIVPGLAIDLLMRVIGKGKGVLRDALLVLCMSAAFVGLVLLVQWNFSRFLLSPAADNAFFAGGRYFPYYSPVGDWKSKFWDQDHNLVTFTSIRISFLIALVSSTIGLVWGNWMAKVQR